MSIHSSPIQYGKKKILKFSRDNFSLAIDINLLRILRKKNEKKLKPVQG